MSRFFRFFHKPIKDTVKDTVTSTGVVLASSLIGSGVYTLGNMAYDFGSRKLTFFYPTRTDNPKFSEKELDKPSFRCNS